MSSQCLNTSISIFRNVRAYRKNLRHEAIAALTKKLRPLVMSVPGREVLVGVLARDKAVQDLSPFCGQARYNPTSVPGVAGPSSTIGNGTSTAYTDLRGFPIVVGVFPELSFADAVNQLADNGAPIDMPFSIGGDKFIQNTSATPVSGGTQATTTISTAGASDDLFTDLLEALVQAGDIEGVITGTNLPGQALAVADTYSPLAGGTVNTGATESQGLLVTTQTLTSGPVAGAGPEGEF